MNASTFACWLVSAFKRRRLGAVVCGVLLAIPGAAQTGSILSASEQAAARKLYLAKCAKCHELYEPKNYSQPDWERWMAAMNRKAKLKPDQAKLLNDYLADYRAGKIAKAR